LGPLDQAEPRRKAGVRLKNALLFQALSFCFTFPGPPLLREPFPPGLFFWCLVAKRPSWLYRSWRPRSTIRTPICRPNRSHLSYAKTFSESSTHAARLLPDVVTKPSLQLEAINPQTKRVRPWFAKALDLEIIAGSVLRVLET
jgi:hypothetical protein